MIRKILHMRMIMRDAGHAFADEVQIQLESGLVIVESGPTHVVLEEPHPGTRRNHGHWWRRLVPQRRGVTITMRSSVDLERTAVITPPNHDQGYGAVWG